MARKSKPAYYTENDIFASRLKEIMERRGLNQTQLAAKIKTEQNTVIQRQTISQYTAGQSKPDTERLAILCKALDVSADYLIGRIEPDNSTGDEKLRMISEYTGLNNMAIQNLHDFTSSPFRHACKKWCNYLLTSDNFMALSIGLSSYELAFAKSMVVKWKHEKEDMEAAEQGKANIRINIERPSFDEVRCAAGWRLNEVLHEMIKDVEKNFGIDDESFIEACLDLIKDKKEFTDFIKYVKSKNEKQEKESKGKKQQEKAKLVPGDTGAKSGQQDIN